MEESVFSVQHDIVGVYKNNYSFHWFECFSDSAYRLVDYKISNKEEAPPF